MPTLSAQSSKTDVNGSWCSIGTSITWYNNNINDKNREAGLTRGYQDRVMDRLVFKEFTNVGHNGGVIAESIDRPVKAD